MRDTRKVFRTLFRTPISNSYRLFLETKPGSYWGLCLDYLPRGIRDMFQICSQYKPRFNYKLGHTRDHPDLPCTQRIRETQRGTAKAQESLLTIEISRNKSWPQRAVDTKFRIKVISGRHVLLLSTQVAYYCQLV